MMHIYQRHERNGGIFHHQNSFHAFKILLFTISFHVVEAWRLFVLELGFGLQDKLQDINLVLQNILFVFKLSKLNCRIRLLVKFVILTCLIFSFKASSQAFHKQKFFTKRLHCNFFNMTFSNMEFHKLALHWNFAKIFKTQEKICRIFTNFATH
jgi:hypothetical protein